MSRRLTGTFFPKLDEKGRLTLPAKYRENFEDGLVVARVQERCLAIYTGADYDRLLERFESQPDSSDETVRKYQRWLNSQAHDDTLDKQGRVVLPQYLREFAGLDRDTVVVGAGNRVEIWEPQRWADTEASLNEMFTT